MGKINTKSPVWALAVTIFLLSAVGCGILFYYFIPNNNSVAAFKEGTTSLVISGVEDTSAAKPEIIDGELMFPYDIVKKYIDPDIYWDEALKKVTITTKDRVIRMKTDSLEAYINNKPVNLKMPATIKNGAVYLPLDFLKDFYNIEITHNKVDDVYIVDFTDRSIPLVKATDKKAVVRTAESIRTPVLKRFDIVNDSEDSKTLRVFDEDEKWYKVRTQEGAIGYIEKRYTAKAGETEIKIKQQEKNTETWKPSNGKINLTWEAMYGGRPDFNKISKMDGLDVVSPTWFAVSDSSGTLVNKTDSKYMEWARQKGYKIWPLVANNFDDIAMTKKLLNNTDARDNLIRQLLSFAALYKIDGFNFDFENIYKEDRDAYTQFIREATPLLKEQGLTVSVDVTIPDGSDNWSLCYDRKALGNVVDYVMLMAYDQHWSTSPDSGSVAQQTWVESNLKKTLNQVPKEKLILGVPYYTRIWKEETGADGKVKVTSQTASMEAAKKAAKDNNSTPVWDDVSGQFYSEYKKDGATYKIWIEDENSINLKSSLVLKYNLAGLSSWRRSDEQPGIWEVLNKNLKLTQNYDAWQNENKEKKYVFN